MLHPQVNVDLDAVEDKITHDIVYRHDSNDQPQPLQCEFTPISEEWPEPPPDHHLHVFISRPSKWG